MVVIMGIMGIIIHEIKMFEIMKRIEIIVEKKRKKIEKMRIIEGKKMELEMLFMKK
jgi:hypothetical protein